MPTLPLYTPNPVADAWHEVRAPGGYEWWYFDAEDAANDRQIVAIFFQGFVFHPEYLRRHFAYLRNPTKHEPALPAEYPCVYLVLYERGRIRAQFMHQYSPKDFSALHDSLNVSIGRNSILPLPVRGERAGERVSDELKSPSPHPSPRILGGARLSMCGAPWKLTGTGPQLLADQKLGADLSFQSLFSHSPMERVFLSQQMTGTGHHWVVANPLCDVTGSIQLNDETISFAGRGYHDHNYGTGPLGPGLKRWIWGRVLLEGRCYTFHFARAKDKSLPDEVHLIEATASGMREINVSKAMLDWSARTVLNLAFPRQLQLDDVLHLDQPRVIDNSPFYLRLTYRARCGGTEATAFCEVAYPHRLRWPILGRMIQMSIAPGR